MKFYFTKTPRIIQSLYKGYTWRFLTDKKELYLTFDDGPTEAITEWVLDTLKAYNAKATFFCIGKNIQNHPTIFKRIVSENHSIGNHTHNHLNGFKNTSKNYIENVLKAEKYIKKDRSEIQRSTLFRPPYGKIKTLQAKRLRSLGYRLIMWDVLSADFDTTISNEKCLENVSRNLENGSVIVFHDSIKASEKLKFALPKILALYTEKGYQFKAII